MSYDIYLNDPVTGETIELDAPHQMTGGTYAIGGTTEAHLNVTYNYAELLYEHLDNEKGIRWLYGQPAADTIPRLEASELDIAALPDQDKPTQNTLDQYAKYVEICDKHEAEGLMTDITRQGPPDPDSYWCSTPANVRRALKQIIALAKMRPDGVWAGD